MLVDDVTAVVDSARSRLGDQASWHGFSGYPDSLALCAIDSTFSLRARYTTVEGVIGRYRSFRNGQNGNPETDGTRELLAAIETNGGPSTSAESLFGNKSIAPGTKTRKSEALFAAATALDAVGIRSTQDLRTAADDDATLSAVANAWLGTKGLGAASWNYLLMLAGRDGVKADRMVIRFVSRAVGEDSVSPERAGRAVIGAAEKLGISAIALDHTIWRHESSRTTAQRRR